MKTRHLLAFLALTACSKASSEKPAPAGKPVEEEPTWENEPSGEEPGPDPLQQAFDAWVAAQNKGDFAAYIANYGKSFVGVRSSGGKDVTLDLAGWTKERQKMFSGGLQVAAESPRFDSAGDHDTVTFVQRYKRGEYADHGLKVLTFDPQLHIIREEMLWSVSGWDNSPEDPIDARDMTPPLTLSAHSVTAEVFGSECRSEDVELTIEDSAGHKGSVIAGSTVAFVEDYDNAAPVGVRTKVKPSKGKSMYRFGSTDGGCAGLTIAIGVQKSGDRIVAIEDWTDNESPDGRGREVRVAFLLPPGAEVTAK